MGGQSHVRRIIHPLPAIKNNIQLLTYVEVDIGCY